MFLIKFYSLNLDIIVLGTLSYNFTLHSYSIMLLMTPQNLQGSVANVILFDNLQHLFVRFLMICYAIDFNVCSQNILSTS